LSNQKCYANQEEIIIITDWNLQQNFWDITTQNIIYLC
jgi:hypothetical protein